jgi:hypothetical protein
LEGGATGRFQALSKKCLLSRSLRSEFSGAFSIKYKIGKESELREWAGTGEDDFVSRVSGFDTQCAVVYLMEKTDVAFRPFGLDLFDKLAKVCKDVHSKLERERQALASTPLPDLQSKIPEGIVVSKLRQKKTGAPLLGNAGHQRIPDRPPGQRGFISSCSFPRRESEGSS